MEHRGIKMSKINQKNAFALLYAILIMFLFMITVSAVMFSSLADIRQYKKAKSSLGAWSAAQSGIEAGLASYKDNPASPAIACNNTTTVQMGDATQGIYLTKVCLTGTADVPYVESVGTYGGVKIKLRAKSISGASIKIYQVGI